MSEARAIWTVVDVGCQECGVSSVELGAYWSADEALAAANERNRETDGWRDGGQTFAEVFRFSVPAGPIPERNNA